MFIKYDGDGLRCEGGRGVADPTGITNPDSDYNKYIAPLEAVLRDICEHMKTHDGLKIRGVTLSTHSESYSSISGDTSPLAKVC